MTIEEYAMEHGLSFTEAQKRLEDEQEDARDPTEEETPKKRRRKVVDE